MHKQHIAIVIASQVNWTTSYQKCIQEIQKVHLPMNEIYKSNYLSMKIRHIQLISWSLIIYLTFVNVNLVHNLIKIENKNSFYLVLFQITTTIKRKKRYLYLMLEFLSSITSDKLDRYLWLATAAVIELFYEQGRFLHLPTVIMFQVHK